MKVVEKDVRMKTKFGISFGMHPESYLYAC